MARGKIAHRRRKSRSAARRIVRVESPQVIFIILRNYFLQRAALPREFPGRSPTTGRASCVSLGQMVSLADAAQCRACRGDLAATK